MLAKEKCSMKNSKTNNLNKFTTFIFVFINLLSTNALSEESHIIKIIEKEWNHIQTLNGHFHQQIDGDKVISGQSVSAGNTTFTVTVGGQSHTLQMTDGDGGTRDVFATLLPAGGSISGNSFQFVAVQMRPG